MAGYKGRNGGVEVVCGRFYARIPLDQLEGVDQVCADVVGLGFRAITFLGSSERALDELERLLNRSDCVTARPPS